MKSRYYSKNVSIYYHFIVRVLNVDYVVTGINSYIQEIDVLLQKKLELMEKNKQRF